MQKHLPGRLGDPTMTLVTDPRMDPRVAAVLAAAGDLGDAVAPIEPSATYEQSLEYCAQLEIASAMTHQMEAAAMPDFSDIRRTTEVIKGVDGNDIKLHIHQPLTQNKPLPCIFHTHGGGMVLMTAEDPGFVRWRNALAQSGLVVVGVEFRNGGGRLGNHPFPAGLNDCDIALRWTDDHRQQLGISAIVMSGESGGGNLALATTLKAKKEGRVNSIQGVYAMCPYISGAYAAPPAQLLSLQENDGYTLDCSMMAALVKVYDPGLSHASNPLAWPYYASLEDLGGLPPHVISVNELDPLRDEGLAFFRRLLAAGNAATARLIPATNHAGDLSFPDIAPEPYQETLRSLRNFAYACA